ncbi:MAG: siroheme synthase [Desulfobacca sp.]|nr:siroheme synthase [Desulfobacca sp.]
MVRLNKFIFSIKEPIIKVPMRYYPVFLDLRDAPCLVIGGGQVGERKVKTLQSCQAKVYLISRDLTPYLREELQSGGVFLLAESYETKFLKDMFLVVGATDDPELNGTVGQEARERGILCNIVDDPQECNFILPSLVTRGDLTIAVSTAGKSPALAKRIRQDLEKEFPEIYGPYLELLGRIRSEVLERRRPQKENQKIFETLIHSPLLSWLEAGTLEPVYDLLDRLFYPPLPRSNWSSILDPLSHPLK